MFTITAIRVRETPQSCARAKIRRAACPRRDVNPRNEESRGSRDIVKEVSGKRRPPGLARNNRDTLLGRRCIFNARSSIFDTPLSRYFDCASPAKRHPQRRVASRFFRSSFFSLLGRRGQGDGARVATDAFSRSETTDSMMGDDSGGGGDE